MEQLLLITNKTLIYLFINSLSLLLNTCKLLFGPNGNFLRLQLKKNLVKSKECWKIINYMSYKNPLIKLLNFGLRSFATILIDSNLLCVLLISNTLCNTLYLLLFGIDKVFITKKLKLIKNISLKLINFVKIDTYLFSNYFTYLLLLGFMCTKLEKNKAKQLLKVVLFSIQYIHGSLKTTKEVSFSFHSVLSSRSSMVITFTGFTLKCNSRNQILPRNLKNFFYIKIRGSDFYNIYHAIIRKWQKFKNYNTLHQETKLLILTDSVIENFILLKLVSYKIYVIDKCRSINFEENYIFASQITDVNSFLLKDNQMLFADIILEYEMYGNRIFIIKSKFNKDNISYLCFGNDVNKKKDVMIMIFKSIKLAMLLDSSSSVIYGAGFIEIFLLKNILKYYTKKKTIDKFVTYSIIKSLFIIPNSLMRNSFNSQTYINK
mmetsp:Transcript_4937/g.9042  ORF Transcript_4937/g.9042 Transcript_4937/m.9042 type:complete len:433 (+) Transcript_4937:840-2138(+)